MSGEGPPQYLISVDLGQVNDFTAISLIEMHGIRPQITLHVREITRPPLGTKYTQIVSEVADLYRRVGDYLQETYWRWAEPPALLARRTILLDATGCGRPVTDMFEQARLRPIPITITGGTGFEADGRGYRVAKPDLIHALVVLVQDERLKIAAALPEAANLVQEFLHFERRVTLSGREQLAVWREHVNDDMILSLAMGAWYVGFAYNVSSQKVLWG
jgi:hypothetical protein